MHWSLISSHTVFAVTLQLCISSPVFGETYDIIPSNWINGDGSCLIENPDESPVLLMIPSPDKAAREAICDASQFLTKGNKIPAGISVFHFEARPAGGKAKSGAIRITRSTRDSPALRLSADAGSVQAIRALDWPGLCRLQRDFALWLLDRSRPRVGDLFRPVLTRFQSFEPTLRLFWHECLKTATFRNANTGTRFQQYTLREPQPPDPSVTETSKDSKRMGVIPLRAGTRLAIRWGGTATYGYQVSSVTRQTTVGTTYVNIVLKNGHATIESMAGVASNGLKAEPVTPYPLVGSTDSLNKMRPFANANPPFNTFVSIFNEFDLRNSHNFARNSGGGGGAPASLVLVMPYSYVKSDQENPGPVWSHEAKSGDAGFDFANYRRFAIWGLPKDAEWSEFDFSYQAAPEAPPEFRPMIFGNQTWIDVELPVSLNGNSTFWIPPRTSIATFLSTNAAWLLHPPTIPGQRPVFRFVRPDSSGGHSSDYRFWVVPDQSELESIELLPGDAIFSTP